MWTTLFSIVVVIAVCLNLAVILRLIDRFPDPIATQYSQADFSYEETTPNLSRINRGGGRGALTQRNQKCLSTREMAGIGIRRQ